MGIFTFDRANKEQALQNELDSVTVQLTQNQIRIKELERLLKEQEESEEQNELAMKRLVIEHDELSRENAQLEIEKNTLYYELEQVKEEKTFFEKLVESLKAKLSKKDESIKEEQRKKSKYKFYFEHGAVDFTKAIALFNDLTGHNLNETKVRTYLVKNNIIYKAGRYFAPTPYAEDFNYVVVYGEHGTTAPKYTFEFLRYLKQKVDEGEL